jgi:F0F1-type ATP synthase gamma subunit
LNNFSELGSRATSMKNTVKNAKDNIKELTFVFNRVRQSKITNELIEILSATL